VADSLGSPEPQHRVEYALVEGIDDYRLLVREFVSGGCAALDGHATWLSDVAELEQARRRRGKTHEKALSRFCKIWANTGYVDPTDSFYVLFDGCTVEDVGEVRDELLQLVRTLELEVVDSPPEALSGEVWVHKVPFIDAELGNWT